MKGLLCPKPHRLQKPVTNLSSWVAAARMMSPCGPKRTCRLRRPMSAFGGNADMTNGNSPIPIYESMPWPAPGASVLRRVKPRAGDAVSFHYA
jgi:hypothetical protein